MAKPELGTKRLCSGCGAKYYDLNRDPITCPKCGTIFEVVSASRAAKASKVVDENDDDEEDDDAGPEIVSLEEADAENSAGEGDDVPDIDGDDVEIDDDADDGIFIDEEDDEDETVPGIPVSVGGDSDD